MDLDTPEAIAAANHFLPFTTWVHGRAGSPRSHRWYVCDPPPDTETFQDLDGTMLVEMRSTGSQTVVPPSTHESGEPIVWHELAGEPTPVPEAELSRRIRLVAAAGIVARHWPAEGSRHQAALALSGALLRGGWAIEQAEAFVVAVADAANDEEGRKRVRDVLSTARRLESGGAATGWPALARLLGSNGDEVVRRVREWTGLAARVQVPDHTPPAPEWPAPPGREAYHGLAGQFVRILDPATEADPVALLVQLLVGFGNLIGRTAHFRVEADTHFGNEFAVLVGKSAKARKGTSQGRVRATLRPLDDAWEARNVSGLSSGEGLIWHVRDAVGKQEKVKERGQPVRYESVVADPGVTDKRLMVVEPAFANVLKQTERQGNVLSATLRQAWETGDLATLTKNSPAKATGAHISVVGHITVEELRRYLTATETANGFGNRFWYLAVQRSKRLPNGGKADGLALAQLGDRLWHAAEFARGAGEVRRDAEADELWTGLYDCLSEDRPGVAGAPLARAEAHVMRLAMLYALLDRSAVIRAEHLAAAAALWDYAERSVVFLFGDATGDPVADDILRLLRACPAGVMRSEITKYLNNNFNATRLTQALGLLLRFNLARMEPRESAGRTAEVCFPAGRAPP